MQALLAKRQEEAEEGGEAMDADEELRLMQKLMGFSGFDTTKVGGSGWVVVVCVI